MNDLEILKAVALNYNVELDTLTKIYDEKYKGNNNWYEELTAKLDSLKYKMLALVYDGYETDEFFIYTEDYQIKVDKYKSYIQDHIDEI